MASPAPSDKLPTAEQILASFYAAETEYMSQTEAERDFGPWAKTLSPDLKLHQSPDLPYGGIYHGHAGFRRWSDEMSRRFDALVVADPKVLSADGADEIVTIATLKLRVRGSGERWEKPFAQVWRVDRARGWVTEIRPFYWDVAGMNAALARAGFE